MGFGTFVRTSGKILATPLTERNLRISKTLFIVVAVSLMFWLPAFVVYFIRELCWQCFPQIVFPLVNALHLANSLINPFLYSFRMQIFRNTLKKYWKRPRNGNLGAVPFSIRNTVQVS